jgi:hypothetical protein
MNREESALLSGVIAAPIGCLPQIALFVADNQCKRIYLIMNITLQIHLIHYMIVISTITRPYASLSLMGDSFPGIIQLHC